MQDFRKPLCIAFISATAVAIGGAALGWFDISNELIKKAAEAELGKKQNLAIGLSAAGVTACLIAAKLAKHRLALLATIIGIYQLIMVVNQKPDSAVATQIGLSTTAGYWMTIIGTLVMIVASAIIGIKGLDVLQSKEDSDK